MEGTAVAIVRHRRAGSAGIMACCMMRGTCCMLHLVWYMLHCCVLRVAWCMLCVAGCVLCVVSVCSECCMWCVACCEVNVACCVLHVVLHVACCMLHAVRCTLHVAHRFGSAVAASGMSTNGGRWKKTSRASAVRVRFTCRRRVVLQSMLACCTPNAHRSGCVGFFP